jgi:hypothetical protein
VNPCVFQFDLPRARFRFPIVDSGWIISKLRGVRPLNHSASSSGNSTVLATIDVGSWTPPSGSVFFYKSPNIETNF